MGNQARHPLRSSSLVVGLVAAFIGANAAEAQAVRDYISIVGSSTVYPFATVVAEQFGRKTSFKTPKVESTGSGGGLKLFCGGVGVEHPDIANSSRRITPSEIATCAQNGVDADRRGGDRFRRHRAREREDVARRSICRSATCTSRSRRTCPIRRAAQKLVANPYTHLG